MTEERRKEMLARVRKKREQKREIEEQLWDAYTRTLFLMADRKHDQSSEAA